ncbi:MAG: host attachment protein [Hyphomicrobiaceae bacterium]
MKPQRTWIVVADGARARVYAHGAIGGGLTPVDGLTLEQDTPASRDLGSDRPGRTFDSKGQGRHAMEPTSDPHRERKRAFAEQLASALGARAGEYDRLVLVAAPVTLGDLRAALPAPASSKVDGELAKDLTKVAAQDLPDHLGDVLVI